MNNGGEFWKKLKFLPIGIQENDANLSYKNDDISFAVVAEFL